ncbi:galactose oxidase kelch, beta-propeller, partial [Trichoderma arundinaceum]
MAPYRAVTSALLALLLHPAHAQLSNWAADQRTVAALIRDKIFIDGGDVSWLPGLKNGSYGIPVDYANYQGIIFTYNLSYAFNADTNVTGLLLQDPLSKAIGGLGQDNGNSPNYIDGALLANDDEFFFYGGLPVGDSVQYAAPEKDNVLVYQAYSYGTDKPLFNPGFHSLDSLPKTVNPFVTFGGAANAPSENLAFYFSGMTSASGGSIFFNFNDTTRPSRVTNSLITVNMTEQGFEKWSNKSAPSTVKGRASSELVWVPVGEKGILVALGGVVFPEYANATHRSQNAQAS